jgi:nucleotide-binding universal stress UspA family protein
MPEQMKGPRGKGERIMKEFEKILFPIDLSEVSQKIVPYAIMMAETFRAELHLLFVARMFKYYDNIYVPPVSINEFEKEIVKGGKRRLDDFVKEHLRDCCIFEAKVVPGDPAEQILHYVRSEGIDLVIMGTHGRKGIDRILFGSVAAHVVKMSPVPVMTVNPYRMNG